METDLKLIRLIKAIPNIYHKNKSTISNDLQTNAWKTVASKIGQSDIWAKRRWNSLVSEFIETFNSNFRDTFKYYNEMVFLIPHINIKKQDNIKVTSSNIDMQPEFVVTEEQIFDSDDEKIECFMLNTSGSDSEDEICTSTVDIMHHSKDNSYRDGIEEGVACEEVAIQNSKCEEYAEIVHLLSANDVDEDKLVSSDEKNNEALGPVNIIYDPVLVETETTINHKSKKFRKTESCSGSDSEVEVEDFRRNSKQTKRRKRCADTIFGELVTETLKEMNESEKRNAKTQIMKILFH